MVGLSVVLEAQKDIHKKAPQVISKASMNMIKPPSPASTSPSTSSSTTFNPFSRRSPSTLLSFPAAGFLECCFLCRQKLLPGRDIYMYKGDKAFCSEECRCRQIFMDEEETSATVKAKADYCSMAAIKPQTTPTSSSSSSSSRCRKGARNRADGFAC